MKTGAPPEDPPRATAYYYGDLERLKQRAWSPEYVTPTGSPVATRQETYSTAGTFPLPLPQKEKEPLLAELELVGRLPLQQLPVRRSRSWFCCPEPSDEVSQTSWRYASLRPVTAPPAQRPHLVGRWSPTCLLSMLRLNPEVQLPGRAGCNKLHGTYCTTGFSRNS